MNGLSDKVQPWAGEAASGFPPVQYFADEFISMGACDLQAAHSTEVGTFGEDVCFSDTGCAVNVTLCASQAGHYKTDKNGITWEMDFELGSMEFFCRNGGCDSSCRDGLDCDLPSHGTMEYLPLEPIVRSGLC